MAVGLAVLTGDGPDLEFRSEKNSAAFPAAASAARPNNGQRSRAMTAKPMEDGRWFMDERWLGDAAEARWEKH